MAEQFVGGELWAEVVQSPKVVCGILCLGVFTQLTQHTTNSLFFFFLLYPLEELACNQLKVPYHTGVGSARPLQAPYFVFFFIVRLRPDPQELALSPNTVF